MLRKGYEITKKEGGQAMILVVGGAGYIGSHTNKELNRRGYDTVVYDNLVYGHRESTCFNLGNGSGVSVRSVIEAAKRVTGKDFVVREEARRAGDPPVLVGSAKKAREILGWEPRYPDIDTIVRHAFLWHQERKY